MDSNHQLYGAAAWWPDCDPSIRVVGYDPLVVGETLARLIEDAQHEAADDGFPGDMCTSGVFPIARGDLELSSEERADLEDYGYAVIEPW